MMNTKEENELPFVEKEKHLHEEEDDDEETGGKGEQSSDDDNEEEEGGEKEEEPPSCPADEMISSSAKEVEEEKTDVLNLNNEVVKMRKEVKRVKALIFRKLARQIAALKKKKGKEAELERNQRRAERLLEEVNCMKKLLPDLVTKTALQKNLNFEQVCKNPKSTLSDRAVARIATHPQFNKKIECIKAAVKSFKEEHIKVGKHGGKARVETHPEKTILPSPDVGGKKKNPRKQKAVRPPVDADSEAGVFKMTEDVTPTKSVEKVEKTSDIVEAHQKEMESVSVRSPSVKSPSKKNTLKPEPQSKAEENSGVQSAPAFPQKQVDEEESDVELSDNEKRDYFDDSTEERFHRQSSLSEESDEDDFFLGKVSKFKKKKPQTGIEGEKKVDKGQEERKDSTDNVRTDKLQSELDELESRLKSKSVFCSSLGGTKSADRGRGGGKFKGQGKPQHGRGVNRDYFQKQSKFQKQEKGASNSGSKYSKPFPEDSRLGSDHKGGRGRGRGRGVQRQKDHRGGRVFAHEPPLHPSWEASKKRKEQQGQILAFQGKKIKFDDD